MEDINTVNNISLVFQQYKAVIVVAAIVLIVTTIISIARQINIRRAGGNFIRQHPEAAKVYLTSKGLIVSETVQVHQVEGKNPHFFSEGVNTGFYLSPGRSTASVSYTHNRPGVLYKNVTTYTKPIDLVLDVEPRTSYLLGFDRNNREFTFQRYDGR